MRDLVPCDAECEHGHGDAVLLGHQAGLAADRALQEGQAERRASDVGQIAGEPAGALDRAQRGLGQAAAVGRLCGRSTFPYAGGSEEIYADMVRFVLRGIGLKPEAIAAHLDVDGALPDLAWMRTPEPAAA